MTTTLAHDVGLTDDILALIGDRAVAADESGHLDEEVVCRPRVYGHQPAPAASGTGRVRSATSTRGGDRRETRHSRRQRSVGGGHWVRDQPLRRVPPVRRRR